MRGTKNTNLIRGVTVLGPVGTQPPSPPSAEGLFCKSGVYAQTVVRLTPGELRSSNSRLCLQAYKMGGGTQEFLRFANL
jgi:hypothetical protein